jgi:chromosome segregation ATPase
MDALSTRISQLHEEMHGGFSNLRDTLLAEIRAVDERVSSLDGRLTRVEGRLTSLDERLTGVDERLTKEIRDGDDRVMDHAREVYAALTEQIQAGDERVMNQARVLHEDLKASLKLLAEGRSSG